MRKRSTGHLPLVSRLISLTQITSPTAPPSRLRVILLEKMALFRAQPAIIMRPRVMGWLLSGIRHMSNPRSSSISTQIRTNNSEVGGQRMSSYGDNTLDQVELGESYQTIAVTRAEPPGQ